MPKLPAVLSVGLLLLASPASADLQSKLPNLLPSDPGGDFEFRFDYTDYNDDALLSDITWVSLAAHFQYVTPSGAGGYADLPFGYVSFEGDSESDLGNIGVGGLYVIRNPQSDIVLRGGLSIDTADDEGDELVPATNLISRLPEAFPTGAATNWARLGGQVRFGPQGSQLRIGGGLALDFPLDNDEFDPDALMTLTGSIGMETPSGFGVAGGLVVVQSIGAENDESITGLNVVVDNSIGPTARLFGALGLGLEEEIEGFSIGAGIRAGF